MKDKILLGREEVEATKKLETKKRTVLVVTRNKMPAKEIVLQKGKRANETTRRTKMVMVTRNEKPTKEKVLEKLMRQHMIRLLMPTTGHYVLRLHIIKSIRLHKEATDLLPEQTQDSSTQMSSAILMPSSNALQVVRIWIIMLTSCGVHQMKSINISNSIMSSNL
jgi:hypothetical protein